MALIGEIDMDTNIYTLIGEATAYDKKQMLEVKRPKSWLKSVSAFANGEGGILIFGISDDDEIMGLADDIGTEKEFLKEDNKFRKEFLKAQRIIYKLISSNPGITIVEMAANIGVSDRQVRKYLKRMTDMKFIVREGGRKNGMWRIIDGDYEDFFERI